MFRKLLTMIFGPKTFAEVHATFWEQWIKAKKYHEIVIGPTSRKYLMLGIEKQKEPGEVAMGDRREMIIPISGHVPPSDQLKKAIDQIKPDEEDDDDLLPPEAKDFLIYPL